jgi:acetyl-CoA carboxylase biotin carboxyl carrier protein
MDTKEIKQLIKLMVDNELTELEITDGQNKVALKRGRDGVPIAPALPIQTTAAPAAEQLAEIKSPMVGTFYGAPNPDGDPYVSVGDAVGKDDVVCIIEAMKVMNEIKAECSGRIAEVCAKNSQPVEFGQVLFRVRP